MARPSATRALGALFALSLTGCGPDMTYHWLELQEGTATYSADASGIEIFGSFTLMVELDDSTFDSGDTSEVYLHRLVFSEDYTASELIPGTTEVFDAEITSADVPLPYQARVGAPHLARFDWHASLPAMDPANLCSRGLRAEVYLSLGDELAHTWLEAKRAYNYGHEPIEWTPDPCPY
jgi:hypothetical protein